IGHTVWSNRAVYRRSNEVAPPRLPWIFGNRIPTERVELRALVAHHHHIWFAIAINVRNQNVMRAGCVFIEHDSFEWLLTRFAGIAIPDAAANEIDGTVAIHVE